MKSKIAIAIIALAGLILSTAEASSHNCPTQGPGDKDHRNNCPGTYEPVWVSLVTCALPGVFPDGLISVLPTSPEISQSNQPLRVAWLLDDPQAGRKWTLSWKSGGSSANLFPGNKVIVNQNQIVHTGFFSKTPAADGTYRYSLKVETWDGSGWTDCAELDPEIRVKDDPDEPDNGEGDGNGAQYEGDGL